MKSPQNLQTGSKQALKCRRFSIDILSGGANISKTSPEGLTTHRGLTQIIGESWKEIFQKSRELRKLLDQRPRLVISANFSLTLKDDLSKKQ